MSGQSHAIAYEEGPGPEAKHCSLQEKKKGQEAPFGDRKLRTSAA